MRQVNWLPHAIKGAKVHLIFPEKPVKATLRPSFPAHGWVDACSAIPLIDEPGLSLNTETMPPGTSEQPHYHELPRQYFHIKQGTTHFLLPEGLVKVPSGDGLIDSSRPPPLHF
jgi:hypothetical protein